MHAVQKYVLDIVSKKGTTMTDMYLKMNASDLIRHYAYLTQAMVHHATAVERLHWSYAKAKEDLQKTRVEKPVVKETAYRGVPTIKKTRGRLNAAKALKIYKSRLSHVELARRYGVHHVTISDIKHGRTWANVTGHMKG